MPYFQPYLYIDFGNNYQAKPERAKNDE